MKKRSLSPVPAQDPLLLEITKLHAEVEQGLSQTIAKGIRIGELLAKKKAELAHGKWESWLKLHAPFSSVTAWRYMRCFEKREDLNLSSTKDLPRSIERFAQISVEREPLVICYDDEALPPPPDDTKSEQFEFQLETQSTIPPLDEQPTKRWQARTIAGLLIALLERIFQDSAQRAQAWDSIKLKIDEAIQQQPPPPKSNSHPQDFHARAKVWFRNEADLQDFAQRIGQPKLNRHSKTTWFPLSPPPTAFDERRSE